MGRLLLPLAVVKWLGIYAIVLTGKLVALVYTPMVYWLRHVAANRIWNYHLQTGKPFQRLDEKKHLYTDRGSRWEIAPYEYTDGGYIYKTEVSTVEYWLWYVFVYMWIGNADENLDITSAFMLKRDERYSHKLNGKPLTNTSFKMDGEWLDIGVPIKHVGSYLLIGDKQRENEVSLWKTFTIWYQYNCIRNGFYGFNYITLDSWIDATSKQVEDWDELYIWGDREVRLAQGVSQYDNNQAVAQVYNSTMGQELCVMIDRSSGWFQGLQFRWASAVRIGDWAFGHEMGWRHQSKSILRLIVDKVSVKDK